MLKAFFKKLGFHIHDWSNWEDYGVVDNRWLGNTIAKVQIRRCNCCGKKQTHQIPLV